MKKVTHVVWKNGSWNVARSASGGQFTSTKFNSKAEAVSAAREKTKENRVVVHTSTGQIIRTPEFKTSRNKESMRSVVSQAVARADKSR